MVFSARTIDRIGKGIRGAPRDALVADVTPRKFAAATGCAALDTIGAFLGPLLAVALMFLWDNDFQSIFWPRRFPPSSQSLLLGFGLKKNPTHRSSRNAPIPRRENLKTFRRLLVGGGYWLDFHPSPASAKPFWCYAPSKWRSRYSPYR